MRLTVSDLDMIRRVGTVAHRVDIEFIYGFYSRFIIIYNGGVYSVNMLSGEYVGGRRLGSTKQRIWEYVNENRNLR